MKNNDEKLTISIENMIDDINEKYDFCYESEQYNKLNNAFLEKAEKICGEGTESYDDLFFSHSYAVMQAEKDYFKAGFCAGMKLLAEGLGMNNN